MAVELGFGEKERGEILFGHGRIGKLKGETAGPFFFFFFCFWVAKGNRGGINITTRAWKTSVESLGFSGLDPRSPSLTRGASTGCFV